MAREVGAKTEQPTKSRIRAKSHLSESAYKSLRLVLHKARRGGLVASVPAFVRLRGWMSREALGSLEDLRSPFWSIRKGQTRTWISREELIKSFDARISKVGAVHGYYSEIITEIEAGQRENISPQSAYLPWEKDGPEKVAEVYSDKQRLKILNTQALERAVERVISLIKVNSIRMTSIDDVIRSTRVNPHAMDQAGMDTHTNSGPPHYMNPWKPAQDMDPGKREESQAAFDWIVPRAKGQLELLRSGNTVSWNAVVAKRLAQKAKIEKRKRIVIALEKAEPLIWKTFTPQLEEALKVVKMPGGCRPFVAWNDLPIIDRDCQLALNVAFKANRVVVGGDYSAYDATLAPWLIELAGKIVGKWIFGGEKLVPALAASMANGVRLITPSMIYEPQPASMKSGSGGTNLIDTVINILVMFYGEELGNYSIVNCAAQGDDFFIDGPSVSPDSVQDTASHFGLVAHPDKQMWKRDVLAFLQRIHLRGWIGGIASAYRTLGSIISYERMAYRPDEWNSTVDIVRAISQLENTAFSPYFETLVKFVQEGDKYSLGSSLAPSIVLRQSGNAAKDWIQRESGKSWKRKSSDDDGMNGFERMAVNGVLRGEVLPPLGSEARFLRVYGNRVV